MTRNSDTKLKARTIEALLLGAALAAAVFSGVLAKNQAAYEKMSANAVPAKATLRLIEIKESGQGQWGAFGKFDVRTTEKLGTLEGDLAPLNEPPVSREKAEIFAGGWKVGETYDALWTPDRPFAVFFAKPDLLGNARTVLLLQISAAVLFLIAIGWNVRRRRT